MLVLARAGVLRQAVTAADTVQAQLLADARGVFNESTALAQAAAGAYPQAAIETAGAQAKEAAQKLREVADEADKRNLALQAEEVAIQTQLQYLGRSVNAASLTQQQFDDFEAAANTELQSLMTVGAEARIRAQGLHVMAAALTQQTLAQLAGSP